MGGGRAMGRQNRRECSDIDAVQLGIGLEAECGCGLFGRTPGLVVQVSFDNRPQYV